MNDDDATTTATVLCDAAGRVYAVSYDDPESGFSVDIQPSVDDHQRHELLVPVEILQIADHGERFLALAPHLPGGLELGG